MAEIDNTVTFTNLYEARDHFESSFAKKELGGIMKNIVIKATPKNAEVYEDANINKILGNAILDVANAAFDNTENDSTFMGGLKELINKYTSMEADYRFQKAEAKQQLGGISLSTEDGQKYLYGLFTSLGFSNPALKERYKDELRSYLSTEAEDIVISIGKEVGEAITQAQTKTAVITETLKAISETKEEIQKELNTDEDDDEKEEEPTSDGSDDMDGSETDFDNDGASADDSDDETETPEEDSSALDEGAGEDEDSETPDEKAAENFEDEVSGDSYLDDGIVFDSTPPTIDTPLDLTEVIPEDAKADGADEVSETKGLEDELIENINEKIDEVNVAVSEVSEEEEPQNEEEIAEKNAEEDTDQYKIQQSGEYKDALRFKQKLDDDPKIKIKHSAEVYKPYEMKFDISKNEYNKMVYGNENIGYVLFPYSLFHQVLW